MTTSSNYDTKITDRNLGAEWQPWLINLSEDYKLVDRSTQQESGKFPPTRMIKVYRKVWEGKTPESNLTRSDGQDDLKVQEKQVSTPEKRGKPLLQNRQTDRQKGKSAPKARTAKTRKRVRFQLDK